MSFIKGTKYLWRDPGGVQDIVLQAAQRHNICIPVAQAVINRGFVSEQDRHAYFFSDVARDVAHPGRMKDAVKAVDRLEQALRKQEKILIFGDYDVDGITSSALMILLLKPLNGAVNFFLPHRARDGYGLSVSVVERAHRNGYSLIITVDNGITAFAAAQRALELGIDLIITDHHKPHGALPPALAIVNPNQSACEYPFKAFAGVGVSFKLLTLLYERLGMAIPDKAYELLLLGTVADVVPLMGENRYWVRHCLALMNAKESFSFKVLKENGKVERTPLSATDIGFSITPQINALGRLEDPRDGVKFLIGTNTQETRQVGTVLHALNTARKDIERSVFNQVVAEIDKGAIDLAKERVIVAASTDWPTGVIGLVASRLVGAYARPAILFHIHNGKAKGSCRSIKEFNIFNALSELSDLLDTYGGHAGAAGLSLPVERLPQFKERLEELVTQQVRIEDMQRKLVLDAQLPLEDVTKKLVSDMQLMEPFGCDNPTPLFYMPSVTLLSKPTILKDAHVKCSVFAQGVIKPVIFFNNPEMYDWLIQHGEQPFDLAVQVTQNHWQGKVSIELIGMDVAGRPN